MADRLAENVPLDWLQIEKHLGKVAAVFRGHMIYQTVSSTNDWALQQCAQIENLPVVCLAESQQQGRGRRGREWVSPQSRNIYLSMAWSFPLAVAELGPLSLIAGLVIVRVLRSHHVKAGLKWPNDVLVAGRKIAGILIESRIKSTKTTETVIGVGINFDMSIEDGATISQQWTDFVREYPGGAKIDRNQLVAEVLAGLVDACRKFSNEGFDLLRDEWREYDLCKGKVIDVISDAGLQTGEALGIDDHGALKVRIGGEIRTFFTADISVRVAQ